MFYRMETEAKIVDVAKFGKKKIPWKKEGWEDRGRHGQYTGRSEDSTASTMIEFRRADFRAG